MRRTAPCIPTRPASPTDELSRRRPLVRYRTEAGTVGANSESALQNRTAPPAGFMLVPVVRSTYRPRFLLPRWLHSVPQTSRFLGTLRSVRRSPTVHLFSAVVLRSSRYSC
jgi:hypothetical protein